MLIQQEADARVAKGAALLDERATGWSNRIDVGVLTLHDPCQCVIGQLTGRSGWWPLGFLRLISGDDYAEYGFAIYPADVPKEWASPRSQEQLKVLYEPLQNAWIREIAQRLHPDPVVANPVAVEA